MRITAVLGLLWAVSCGPSLYSGDGFAGAPVALGANHLLLTLLVDAKALKAKR